LLKLAYVKIKDLTPNVLLSSSDWEAISLPRNTSPGIYLFARLAMIGEIFSYDLLDICCSLSGEAAVFASSDVNYRGSVEGRQAQGVVEILEQFGVWVGDGVLESFHCLNVGHNVLYALFR
jgi:hypothetical protein